jgi:hypothetical protein
MIPTPYAFEANFTPEEFQKIGQFASRWAHVEHMAANCLRRLLDLSPKHATFLIFPLNLDQRMTKIADILKQRPLSSHQMALHGELKPLIRGMQYIRNVVLHGVVIDLFPKDGPFFHLRSRDRKITKAQLFSCEDVINYAAHVMLAFRLSLGEEHDPAGKSYALPDRPPIPDFLPDDCRAFPKGIRQC